MQKLTNIPNISTSSTFKKPSKSATLTISFSEYVDFSQEIQFNSELKNKFSNKNSSRNYLKLQIAKCLDKAKENFNVTETTVLEILSWHENNDSDFYCLCICGEEYEVALKKQLEAKK